MLFFTSSVLLLLALGASVRYRRDILHPGFWTNLGFVGYAVGGFYFAFFGTDNAFFFDLAGIEFREDWFSIAMLVVLIGWAACNFGFAFGSLLFVRRNVHNPPDGLPRTIIAFSKQCAVLLILLGGAYWLYMANAAAGGIMNLFQNVGAYRYLMADAGVTSLPLRLTYAGMELWMLAWLSGTRKPSAGLLFLPLGFIMSLSSGRISASVVLVFSAFLAYFMIRRGPVRARMFVRAFLLLMPLAVLFYFYRQYSSYAYIEKPDAFVLGQDPLAYADDSWDRIAEQADYVISSLVGGGNIPDLQQIVLVIKGVLDGALSLTWGSTYLDGIRNFGASELQSVGFRILNAYFPDKVGGPTPGMIGEAILNFWVLAPLAVGFFGFAMVWFYGRAARSRSMLVKLLYCKFLIGIWALFLKVDSSLLLGYFWMAVPISLCWFSLLALNNAMRPTGPDGFQEAKAP